MDLLLSRLVQGRCFQQSTTIMDLDNVSIRGKFPGTTHLDVIFTVVLGKAPLETLQNLLTSGKLELATTNRFNDMGFILILGTNTDEDLTNRHTSGDTNGLSVRVTHTGRKTIGAGTTQHFVGTQDVEGVRTDANVVAILSDVLTQVLVDGDTTSLQGLGRDLLLFVADQMGDKGEQIDGRLLGTHIVNTNLGFRNTTAVPRLDVRLVLLVTVATRRTTTHLESQYFTVG
mmetsp:Transcript_33175/g.94321  ORF Transcript_33175/g.94321 Transcript_33175/m.94321 type:complete len:230 (-) Transcript_33175:48-737(-)